MRDDAADAGVAGVSVVCLRTRDAAAIGQRHPWRLRYRPTLTALLMALSTPLWAQWVTVDPTFPTGSGPNAFVRTVAVQPNGQILVAGTFTNISGSIRPYIARLECQWRGLPGLGSPASGWDVGFEFRSTKWFECEWLGCWIGGIQRHGLGDGHVYESGRAASQSGGAIATRWNG